MRPRRPKTPSRCMGVGVGVGVYRRIDANANANAKANAKAKPKANRYISQLLSDIRIGGETTMQSPP